VLRHPFYQFGSARLCQLDITEYDECGYVKASLTLQIGRTLFTPATSSGYSLYVSD
jgi:hypothetical protein